MVDVQIHYRLLAKAKTKLSSNQAIPADLLAELVVELHLDSKVASSAVAAAAGKKPAEKIEN